MLSTGLFTASQNCSQPEKQAKPNNDRAFALFHSPPATKNPAPPHPAVDKFLPVPRAKTAESNLFSIDKPGGGITHPRAEPSANLPLRPWARAEARVQAWVEAQAKARPPARPPAQAPERAQARLPRRRAWS